VFGLRKGDYTAKIFFLYEDKLAIWEYWGEKKFSIDGNDINVQFTRNMPWISGVSPWMPEIRSNDELIVEFTIKNETSHTHSGVVEMQIGGGVLLQSKEISLAPHAVKNVEISVPNYSKFGDWPLFYFLKIFRRQNPADTSFDVTDHSIITDFLHVESDPTQISDLIFLPSEDQEGNSWALGLDYKNLTGGVEFDFYDPQNTMENLVVFKNDKLIIPNVKDVSRLLQVIDRQLSFFYPNQKLGPVFDANPGIWRGDCTWSWACKSALTLFSDSERLVHYKNIIRAAISAQEYPFLNSEIRISQNGGIQDLFIKSIPDNISTVVDDVFEEYSSFQSNPVHMADTLTKVLLALKSKHGQEAREALKKHAPISKVIKVIDLAELGAKFVWDSWQYSALSVLLAESAWAETRLQALREAYIFTQDFSDNALDNVVLQAINEVEEELATAGDEMALAIYDGFFAVAKDKLQDSEYVAGALKKVIDVSGLLDKVFKHSLRHKLHMSKSTIASSIKAVLTIHSLFSKPGEEWEKVHLTAHLSRIVLEYAKWSNDYQSGFSGSDGVLDADELARTEPRAVYDLLMAFNIDYLNRGLTMISSTKKSWGNVIESGLEATVSQATSPPWALPINYSSTAMLFGAEMGKAAIHLIHGRGVNELKSMLDSLQKEAGKKNKALNEWAEMLAALVEEEDADGDLVPDTIDRCPETPKGMRVNRKGCPDEDGDNVADNDDLCPFTPFGAVVDEKGCAYGQGPDEDEDNVPDDMDRCPNTPEGIQVNSEGCPDADGDGIADDGDHCPGTDPGAMVDVHGCATGQRPDSDHDNVPDDIDQCPGTPEGVQVNSEGCPDKDGDGVRDDDDLCPVWEPGTKVDANGCLDSDGDGIGDRNDLCPNTLEGVGVGPDGCPHGEYCDYGPREWQDKIQLDHSTSRLQALEILEGPGGIVHAFWGDIIYDQNIGRSVLSIYYSKKIGNYWSIRKKVGEAEFTQEAGFKFDAVVDAQNEVHMAWHDGGSIFSLTPLGTGGYSKDSIGGTHTGRTLRLEIDGKGVKHLFIHGNGKIHYYSDSGNGFIEEASINDFDSYHTEEFDLAVDKKNNVHVVYRNNKDELSYRFLQHKVWSRPTILENFAYHSYPSITVDTKNNIHLSWNGRDTVYYTYKDSSGWHSKVLVPDMVGSPKLTVDPGGIRHINAGSLHTRSCDGAHWEKPYHVDPDIDLSHYYMKRLDFTANSSSNLHVLFAELQNSSGNNAWKIHYKRMGLPDSLDRDKDGVPDNNGAPCLEGNVGDCSDNCPDIYNPEQKDMDFDGVGDTCDDDLDGDGVDNDIDNCPLHPNSDQMDSDGNDVGDACDIKAYIENPYNNIVVYPGNSINFQGEYIGTDASVSFHWDFGGAAPSSIKEDPGEIKMSKSGVFTVRFTVQDSSGNFFEDAITVEVIPKSHMISWKKQNTPVSGRTFHAVDFVDTNTGWIVGDSGTVLKTQNGGDYWSKLSSSSFSSSMTFHGVDFLNRDIGWIVGENAVILKTQNGGSTWSRQVFSTNPSYNYILTDVEILSKDEAWISGYAVKIGEYQSSGYFRLHTVNGGLTWLKINPSSGFFASTLNDVFFLDENQGWMVGDRGFLLKTINAGDRWSLSGDYVDDGRFDVPYAVIRYYFNSVQFINENEGWVAGKDTCINAFCGFNSLVLHTQNGGAYWEQLMNHHVWGEVVNKIYFATPYIGWTWGGEIIRKTEDKGANWAMHRKQRDVDLKDAVFLDGEIWAIGSDSTILYYPYVHHAY
jgi:photosystem II stability/assembly factor-like uncharacterized protein